jgi:hypothetical protein
MALERVRCLIKEYKLAQQRLDAIRGNYVKAEVSFDIREVMEQDFKIEIKRAEEAKDTEQAKYWQSIRSTFLDSDKDILPRDTKDKEKAKISGETEKLIVYYERKLEAIKKLLGHREAELLDNYEEKNILMGSEHHSGRILYEQEEEAERKKREEDKGKYTFDKM